MLNQCPESRATKKKKKINDLCFWEKTLGEEGVLPCGKQRSENADTNFHYLQ